VTPDLPAPLTTPTAAPARTPAPKARPEAEAGDRYAEVVDAAAELFARQGYAATSMQQVADAVGLLKGSLYHYINSKEDLLYAVVQEAHHHTARQGYEALTLAGDARAKLTFLIGQHLRGAGENLAKVRVFYNESASLSPERLHEIVADRDTYEHCLRKLIESGQAEGTFAPHLDPTLTAIAILATLNSVQQWFRPDGPKTLDEVVDAFTDLILRSVLADPGGRPSSGRRPRRQRRG
jgi:AcrR family transcriptional regulator